MKVVTALLAATVALAACTTSNTGYPQPSSRGGGWDNFRADVSGRAIEVTERIAANEVCLAS